MKNFINYHILISHSPSCLNRDDMNMQKSAIFGGERRVRISSQSLKRAIRKSDYYSRHIGNVSIRTKKLKDLVSLLTEELSSRFEPDLVLKVVQLLSAKDLTINAPTEGDAVAPWAVEEVAWFCDQIQKKQLKDLDEKAITKALKKQIDAMRQSLLKSVDIALSGRMATSGLMSELGKIDGAFSIAHALTTHTVDADIDWFTAVDDLQELGSGHLDTQEFSSGVFYRYASLNIQQLQENLGKASREKVLELAAHLLHMLATVVPTAKQQAFAAHNLADLAMVSFSDMPISLANAFEEPVRAKGGFLKPSIDALHTYWKNVHLGYGLDDSCSEFLVGQAQPPDGIVLNTTLDKLKAWVRVDGKEPS